jgi:hypothetical protein
MAIFISYSSKDQKFAEAICTAIENRGFPCWISSRDIGPGENFQTQIVRAIRAARVMVLVFSGNANNSEEIKKEMVLAGQSRLVVIPVRVEDVTPGEAFAYEFATRQWIDVFGDWENAIHRVVQQIETVAAIEDAAEAPHAKPAETNATIAPTISAPPASIPAKTPPPRGMLLISVVGAAAVVVLAVAAWLVLGSHVFSQKTAPPVAASDTSAPTTPPAVSSSKPSPFNVFDKGTDAVKPQR